MTTDVPNMEFLEANIREDDEVEREAESEPEPDTNEVPVAVTEPREDELPASDEVLVAERNDELPTEAFKEAIQQVKHRLAEQAAATEEPEPDYKHAAADLMNQVKDSINRIAEFDKNANIILSDGERAFRTCGHIMALMMVLMPNLLLLVGALVLPAAPPLRTWMKLHAALEMSSALMSFVLYRQNISLAWKRWLLPVRIASLVIGYGMAVHYFGVASLLIIGYGIHWTIVKA